LTKLCLILMFLIVALQEPTLANQNAYPNEEKPESLNIFLTIEDISISSIFGYKDFYFTIPPSWKLLPGSFLDLVISHSKAIKPDLSGLTIYLNGMPIYSIPLDDSNSLKTSIKIPIPEGNLKRGINILEVKGFLKTTGRGLTDVGNPINWVKVHKESYVRLKYFLRKDLSIKDFPSPYFEENVPQDEMTAFILPQNWSDTELKAVLVIVLDWVRRSPLKWFAPKIFTFDELNEEIKETYNLIYIGKATSFTPEVLKEFNVDIPSLGEGTIISSLISKNKKAKLLVSSKGDDGISRGALSLLSPEITKQIEGDKAYIPPYVKIPSLSQKALTTGNIVYFNDLIKRDIVFKGAYSHSDAIALRIPQNWLIKGTPYLAIQFRHSPNLNSKRSALTILINGIPIKSVELSPQNAAGDKVTIPIPYDSIKQGLIYVTFEAYLDIDILDTDYNYPEIAWLVIEKYSYFSIPHEIGLMATTLENLPYTIPNAIGVLLGREKSSKALNTLLYCLMGLQKLNPQTLQISILNLDKEKLLENSFKTLIVLAPIEELEKAGIKIPLNEIPALPSFIENATLWQIQNLKGKENPLVLVISWIKNHPKLYPEYEKTLLEWKLKGNIAMVSGNGEVIPFYTSEAPTKLLEVKIKEQSFFEKIWANLSQNRNFLGLFLLTFITISIVILIIFIKIRKQE